ncbi:uncharacterized protein BO72DRAFT_114405 [Aspergillus fijiensis CBS 313.89]|uniref:Uncharacterized protein n=1 Tax=Aspergillus fijiensis CBS 313.89 TaxID=1448319 RepID=A0A8G1RR63_9EURO|nr:uncharacterized protein BO72DRAFT_114405 [Aspergillus fijiensis CBS 313.89]RAK77172.1 hypothetical protein BO72DRAFT_114405 [Aspergillus fijiensis CBS 313.89]
MSGGGRDTHAEIEGEIRTENTTHTVLPTAPFTFRVSDLCHLTYAISMSLISIAIALCCVYSVCLAVWGVTVSPIVNRLRVLTERPTGSPRKSPSGPSIEGA